MKEEVYRITPSAQTTITILRGRVNQPVDDFRETEGTIRTVTQLSVFKNDTEAAKPFLRLNAKWHYNKKSTWMATHSLTITDADF